MSRIVALSAFALIFLTSSASALDPTKQISQYAHSAWRMQDGWFTELPNVVTRTTDGYLWVGTDAGLLRFNGVRFEPWVPPAGSGLPRSDVLSLLGSSDGSLWIGTGRGLARLKNDVLVTYANTDRWVNSIVEDRQGAIWLVRSNSPGRKDPLCRVIGNSVRCYGKPDGIPIPTARRLAADGEGNLWIGGYAGLCRWRPGSASSFFQRELESSGKLVGVEAIAADGDGTVWAGIENPGSGRELQRMAQGVWKGFAARNLNLSSSELSALLIDRDHALWIGTRDKGVYRVHNGDIDHFSNKDGLSSDAVGTFYEDREGTLWVTTSKGIDNFRELRVSSYSMREGLSADSVSTVLASRSGTVWIGNSGAIDFISHEKVEAIRERHGLPGRNVTTMLEDHLGRLWVGVDSALWVYEKGRFRSVNQAGAPVGIVFAITEDTRGNIWVRAGERLLRIHGLEVQEELSSPQISNTYALAASPAGGIWLGLESGDLIRYLDGKMDSFPANPGENSGQARGILPDPDGSVWVATQIGLVRWKDGQRRTLTVRNGLPCNGIYTLVRDDQGSLWLYTRCGLVRLSERELNQWWDLPDKQLTVRTFDVFDGAQPGLTPLQPQAAKSPDGRLWFANKSILQMIDPNRPDSNELPPAVHIEKVTADRKHYVPKSNLQLPPLTRDLEIEYAALSFVAIPKVHYRYKLEGYDRNWIEPQTRREAFYSGLSPGNYRFHVIACNNNGVWNETGAALDLRILPMFYQTPWFFGVCITAAAGLLWLFYVLRVKQVSAEIQGRFEERLGERMRIARELHDTLLQNITGLSLQLGGLSKVVTSPESARQRLRDLKGQAEDCLREARQTVWDIRSSESEAVDLSSALRESGEQFTAGKQSQFVFAVEGEPRPIESDMRLQLLRIGREAIGNAAHHAQARRIEARLIFESCSIRLRISDDGCGFDLDQATKLQGHFGLATMHERAAQIRASVSLSSTVGQGTFVEIDVPTTPN